MAIALKDHVLTGVEEQIRDLQPGLAKQGEIAAVLADVNRLTSLVATFPPDATTNKVLPDVKHQVEDIQAGKASLPDFGAVLVELSAVQQSLEKAMPDWITAKKATSSDTNTLESLLLDLVLRVGQLLNYRPDVTAIMDDLNAIKHLRGGPADAEAFHDFQVLQLAFKSVWMHAFDGKLKDAAAQLYDETVRLYDDLGLEPPNLSAVEDLDQLQSFIKEVKAVSDPKAAPTTQPPSPATAQNFPEALTIWNLFSDEQRSAIDSDAAAIEYHRANDSLGEWLTDNFVQFARDEVATIIKHPQGAASRLGRLIAEIGKYLSEPYAFDIFAPGSYNFGLMITYRQKWLPGEYQAGDLVATIPLTPAETRKYTKKRVVKRARAEKEIQKSMSSRSTELSEVTRAEAEIMQKATTATNFKMTAHGSFNIGIGSIDSSSEFGTSQDQQSVLNKKAFHESTIKAAEQYRLERSMEVDTSASVETEDAVSGEISNPNNEITVTYLFYELQRRFKIHEFLYRVRPVILIAQEVPAPDEIDEAWLIEHQWILARVLLDDSLRPALDYLVSGFAGDETSVQVIKAQWEVQAKLTKGLESQVSDFLIKRDFLRGALVDVTEKEDIAKTFEMSTALKVFTFGMAPDPAHMAADQLEAARKAYATRLQYSEQELSDAQDKLKQASDSFRQATKEYATAMQNQYARHVAIDQLRVHVKQNIFYYLQAIWDHEPPDQRFFRLYNNQVVCPDPQQDQAPSVTAAWPPQSAKGAAVFYWIKNLASPGPGHQHDLIEMADLDNPIGYKGNYIIFPLKHECYLTWYMLTDFIDNYLGVRDADGSDDFDAEGFDQEWRKATENKDQVQLDKLRKQLTDYITMVRRSTDEIIVPTGQLFIEALPGSHPLLEDFKLLHRFEDVRKVRADVRHAELENLRLASRLAAGQDNVELLEDPDIEKKVVVEGNASVVVGSN